MNDLLPQSIWRFPSITFSPLFEELDELLPTASFLHGLAVSEDEKQVYVEASIPGLDPKEVTVTFSKGVVTIKGEKKEEEKGKTYHRKATRSFFYRVRPGDIDEKATPKAICKNGVMTVSFLKMQKKEPEKIAVKIA